MPNTIKIKNSGTANAVPSSLANGELALNYNDGSLFFKNAANQIAAFTATLPDGSVSTAKLAADAVTYAKIQNVSATDRILGRSSAGSGDVEEIVCTAAGRALLDDADAAAQRATLGAAAAADGVRAWVNFNAGTSPITIRGSLKVSSITDHGVGDFVVNFTSGTFSDSNYATLLTSSAARSQINGAYSPAQDSIRISFRNAAGDLVDPEFASVAVFR